MKHGWGYGHIIAAMAVFLSLVSCGGTSHHYAPVIKASGAPTQTSNRQGHRVRPGETLYAIAWRYNLDYRDLARMNHLSPPYPLTVGQRLRIKANSRRVKAVKRPVVTRRTRTLTKQKQPLKRRRSVSRTKQVKVLSNRKRSYYKPVKRWYWPTKGKIISRYNPRHGRKGINIIGRRGQAIRSVASGQVAYSGNGLRGYGKLLIIKHNSEYLSAYAHNSRLKVKEGDWVKAGQLIAEMGSSGAKRVMLHFELRKAGKPINPLRYLRKR